MIQTQIFHLPDIHFHPAVTEYEAFRPELSLLEATSFLIGQPTYTHFLIPADVAGRFMVVFVAADGKVEHDFIKIVNHTLGIFLNGGPYHIGSLRKVVRDVMGF